MFNFNLLDTSVVQLSSRVATTYYDLASPWTQLGYAVIPGCGAADKRPAVAGWGTTGLALGWAEVVGGAQHRDVLDDICVTHCDEDRCGLLLLASGPPPLVVIDVDDPAHTQWVIVLVVLLFTMLGICVWDFEVGKQIAGLPGLGGLGYGISEAKRRADEQRRQVREKDGEPRDARGLKKASVVGPQPLPSYCRDSGARGGSRRIWTGRAKRKICSDPGGLRAKPASPFGFPQPPEFRFKSSGRPVGRTIAGR